MQQLQNATVNLTEAEIRLTYDVVGELPQAGHWLLSTTFSGGEHGPIDQLGFKSVDGRLVSVFVFDLSSAGGQQHYSVNPQQLGDTWSIVFPRSAVRATTGTWIAQLDLNGLDVGEVSGAF